MLDVSHCCRSVQCWHCRATSTIASLHTPLHHGRLLHQMARGNSSVWHLHINVSTRSHFTLDRVFWATCPLVIGQRTSVHIWTVVCRHAVLAYNFTIHKPMAYKNNSANIWSQQCGPSIWAPTGWMSRPGCYLVFIQHPSSSSLFGVHHISA